MITPNGVDRSKGYILFDNVVGRSSRYLDIDNLMDRDMLSRETEDGMELVARG